jgi:hypothetical protein
MTPDCDDGPRADSTTPVLVVGSAESTVGSGLDDYCSVMTITAL